MAIREADISAKSQRKFRMTTTDLNHTQPVAENVLNWDFTVQKRNQKWVADITYIAILEGWLYLAAVIDLFTRKVVDWSMSERIDSRLVVNALEMAVSRELPDAELMAHSDRGAQYSSEHYQGVLAQHDIECRTSRKGNCWESTEAAEQSARMQAKGDSPQTLQPRASSRRSRRSWCITKVTKLAKPPARACSMTSKCFTSARDDIQPWAMCPRSPLRKPRNRRSPRPAPRWIARPWETVFAVSVCFEFLFHSRQKRGSPRQYQLLRSS